MKKLDDSALEAVFKHHYPRLCHFAWQLLGDHALAEDAVQDAFLAYWKNRKTVSEHEVAVKNFLYTSVRNACLNAFRRAKVIQRYAMANNATEWVEEPNIIHHIIRSEVMDEVFKVMQTMPSGCKNVFRLGYLEGLSNPEIAKELNISVNTVKTQKQRALHVLRTKLNPEFFGWVAALLLGT